ncbi:unnamed protein product [Nesidiocoris tenuis]|uniref:Craniofacial development protein 1 n=1 Tax=Nesidiocoris tenuis TaxID=355587 RepID=A0A6H5GJV2_9HEMI|nr:unnamed protein product [Nesidiocoris tenuis]
MLSQDSSIVVLDGTLPLQVLLDIMRKVISRMLTNKLRETGNGARLERHLALRQMCKSDDYRYSYGLNYRYLQVHSFLHRWLVCVLATQITDECAAVASTMAAIDFMKDVGSPVVRKKPSDEEPSRSLEADSLKTDDKPASQAAAKVKITEIFEFAGEKVEVEKEVPCAEVASPATPSGISKKPIARPSRGGISNILGQLGKKGKLSTLEKSKLDWNKFKKEEGIDEELDTFNKGKNGKSSWNIPGQAGIACPSRHSRLASYLWNQWSMVLPQLPYPRNAGIGTLRILWPSSKPRYNHLPAFSAADFSLRLLRQPRNVHIACFVLSCCERLWNSYLQENHSDGEQADADRLVQQFEPRK